VGDILTVRFTDGAGRRVVPRRTRLMGKADWARITELMASHVTRRTQGGQGADGALPSYDLDTTERTGQAGAATLTRTGRMLNTLERVADDKKALVRPTAAYARFHLTNGTKRAHAFPRLPEPSTPSSTERGCGRDQRPASCANAVGELGATAGAILASDVGQRAGPAAPRWGPPCEPDLRPSRRPASFARLEALVRGATPLRMTASWPFTCVDEGDDGTVARAGGDGQWLPLLPVAAR
jgi:hypothetical protein